MQSSRPRSSFDRSDIIIESCSYSSSKMPRVTRSSQKQIEFRCRKTRSQQKEIEGEIEHSQSKPTRSCSISPRKRRDPAKGKLKTFSFLYSTSVHPQIGKRFVTNAAILNNFTFLEFLIMKSTCSSHLISQATKNKHISRATITVHVELPWKNCEIAETGVRWQHFFSTIYG